MTNIIVNLQEYVLSLGLYAPLSVDSFKGYSEEMVIRQDPSSAKTNTYMDLSREGEFKFSILAKSKKILTATTQLSKLISDLDLTGGLELTDLLRIKIEPVTAVRFVTKTEKLEFVYSTDFKLNYFERGK